MTAAGTDDGAIRAEVLDVERSFIVEAPAGSGKTALLTQRTLALLATVEQPEEVLAITFTRRATGEMRERILRALEAAEGPVPESEHEQLTWRLAAAVLERDRQLGWELPRNPARLRVLTIDGLCAALVRRMPWTSRLGADAAIIDDPVPLYREAARETLALLEDPAWAEPLATLLQHLENDVGRYARLIVEMLGRRDQWLRLLSIDSDSSSAARTMLEAVIDRSITADLEALASAVPPGESEELVSIVRFAGDQLATRDPEHPGAACAPLSTLPRPEPESLDVWCGIAEILLKKDGGWRAAFRVSDGFPPKDAVSAGFKARALALVARLEGCPGLRDALHALRNLPPPRYSEAQWSVLDALLTVLRLSAAMLRVVFTQRAQSDYIELAAGAGVALGESERPTDLALALDHRIRHILVDEFQDTSHTHFALLEQLVAGWMPGDGRTFFAVGDPMQSIYRFREADVGLFLRAAEAGVGDVTLEHRRLTRNFRSRPALIDWLNETFPAALAPADRASDGAVAYRPARAARQAEPAAGVSIEVFEADREAEASRVVDTVAREIAAHPEATIAVLVRSRSHLERILPGLDAAGIGWRGVDLAPLGAVNAVRDLVALARAAMHRADRLAWLAVLRAPWCGLSLEDLHRLCARARASMVSALVADDANRDRLTPDGARRLGRVRGPLLALLDRGEGTRLSTAVERAWYRLGGPAVITPEEVPDVREFFRVLRRLEDEVEAPDAGALAEAIARHHSSPAIADARVEVMTVHRAKGLEFDVVIVPCLDRPPPPDPHRLLIWSQSALDVDGVDLLLAPIPDARGEQGPLYDYVRRREAEKHRLEIARLLYVAATRARERLYLNAGASFAAPDEPPRAPHPGSLAAPIWPALALVAGTGPRAIDSPTEPASRPGTLRRLPVDWVPPALPGDTAWEAPPELRAATPGDAPVEFDWAGPIARNVGILVHRVLCALAGAEPLPTRDWVEQCRPGWRRTLAGFGVPPAEIDAAVARVVSAVLAVLADERGRWLLCPHEGHAAELALTGVVDAELVRVVIDRTFLDDDGTRWIVDYKTGHHEGGRLEEFLARERERYRAQLEGYANLFALTEQRPVRLGLYFPLMPAFLAWEPPA